jgi:hypothetical protein
MKTLLRVLRFIAFIIPSIFLMIISPLFPEGKNSEFAMFTRTNARRFAAWMIGYDPIL